MRVLTFLLLFYVFLPGFGQNAPTLSLKQSIETALSNNITMKQGEATIETNRINLAQSKMNQLPNLNAGASQSLNFGRSVNPYDNSVVANQRVNSNNLSLTSSINVFSGFQNRHSIGQRKLNLQASQEDILTTKNSIVLGVVEAFANVLSNRAILLSSQNQFESTQAQLQRTEKLVDAGRLPITSLYDLKAQLAMEETNIVLAENNLDLAKLSLAQWMQVDPTSVQDVAEPTMVIEEGAEKTASEIYVVAEQTQPQIKAAATRVLGSEKGIQLAKSGYYPSLNFQAGLFTNYSSLARNYVQNAVPDTTNSTFKALISDGNGNQIPVQVTQSIPIRSGRFVDLSFFDQFDNNLRKGFSFNLSVPIFNGYQTRYSVETARISKLNAKLQLDQQKNQLRQTIQTAVANEKAARKRLQAIEKQISAFQEAFRSAEQRFNLGVLNPVDYLLAKNNLARAQNDKLRFRYDFFIRRALLDFYLGKELNFN